MGGLGVLSALNTRKSAMDLPSGPVDRPSSSTQDSVFAAGVIRRVASPVSERPSEDLFGTGRVAASPRDVLVRTDEHQLCAVPLTQMRPCREIDGSH